jgi:DNA-binding MarR family transcriptional regulator
MADPDRLEELVAQWHAVRPDLDTGVMAEVSRLLLVARLMRHGIAMKAREHGLHIGEGDVLFTLFRAGPPHRLTPTELADSTLVATGTMTNRLDKLETRGLLRRIPSTDDRRSLAVELTPAGIDLVNELVEEHVANEEQMLAGLSRREREQLARLTRKLLTHLAAD